MAAKSRPERLSALFHDWIRHEWAPVLFVVSLVVVLHHAGPPLRQVGHLSLTVLASLTAAVSRPVDAAKTAADGAAIWLVGIDEEDFQTRFLERQPLSRCELLKDLTTLLDAVPPPKVLAIDLDLSPVAVAPFEVGPDCQGALQSKLMVSGRTQVVLIDPFEAHSDAAAKKKTEWKFELDREHIFFADAAIEYPLHMAIEYQPQTAGFAERAFRLENLDRRTPCEARHQHQCALNWKAYLRDVHELKASDLSKPHVPLQGKTVVYGLRAGRSDIARTPIGAEHGVVVQAAKLATIYSPMKEGEWFKFVLDLFVATLYSLFVFLCLRQYVWASGNLIAARHTAWLVLMAIGSAIFAALALFLAFGLILWCDRVTEPLLIMVGLAIDGLIVAGWRHIGAPPGTHVSCSHAADRPWAVPVQQVRRWFGKMRSEVAKHPWLGAVEVARWAVFWGILMGAFWHVVKG